MEYIRQMNEFLRRSEGVLDSYASNLYLRLFALANQSGWKDEWISTTNEWLMLKLKTTNHHVIDRAKKDLRELGFIDVIPGGNHKPSQYRLIPLYQKRENGVKNEVENEVANRVQNRVNTPQSSNGVGNRVPNGVGNRVNTPGFPPTYIDVRDKTEKEKDVVVGVEVRARDTHSLAYPEEPSQQDANVEPTSETESRSASVIPLSEVREKKAASTQAETARSPDFAQPQQWKAVVDTYQQMRPITNEIERDKLIDLVDNYSATWVIEAVKIAIYAGARSIRYVEGILENWKSNGFGAKPKQERMDGLNGRAGSGRRYSGQQKFFGKTGGNSRASSGRISPDDIDWSKPENQTNGW